MGPEKAQIGHSVIHDCTWNGTATKAWKGELPEGDLREEPEKCQIGDAVIYDCTWNGTASKASKRGVRQGVFLNLSSRP
jgi:hypothetical protein